MERSGEMYHLANSLDSWEEKWEKAAVLYPEHSHGSGGSVSVQRGCFTLHSLPLGKGCSARPPRK